MITAIGFLFRGWFFNQTVSYKSIGLRTNYPTTNATLTKYIEIGSSRLTEPDIHKIIKLGLSKTSERLKFTAEKNDNNPNMLIISKTAHCIGYASFFATTCNYLLKKYNLNDNWTAKPQIGQLSFFGINVHKYFHSSFFENHDFVIIQNKTTGEILAVDPIIHDYLGINFINYTR